MNRRGSTFALRRLLLAAALTCVWSAPSFARQNPPGNTPAQPAQPTTPPPQQQGDPAIGLLDPTKEDAKALNALTYEPENGPEDVTSRSIGNLQEDFAYLYYQQVYDLLAPWQQAIVNLAAAAGRAAQLSGLNPRNTGLNAAGYQAASDLANAYWSLQTDENALAIWTKAGATYYIAQFQASIAVDKQNIARLKNILNFISPRFDTSYGHLQELFPSILKPQGASLTPANPSVFATLERPSASSALAFSNEEPPQVPDDIALAYAMLVKAPPPPPVFQPRWTAWASGGGGYNRASGNSDTFTSRAFMGAGGVNYYFTPNSFVGLALGGSDGPWSTASGASGHGDTFLVALQGRTQAGPLYLAGWLNAANDWQNSTRFAAGDQVVATFQTQSYGGRIETGYRYGATPIIGITPYAAVQVQAFHTPGYSETDLAGGIQAASYNATNATDTQSELGARFDTSQSLAGMTLIMRARAAWAHDWVSGWSATALFQSAPGVGFTISGIKPPGDSALTTLETALRLNPNWSVAAKFDGQFGNSWQTYTGTATLRYAW